MVEKEEIIARLKRIEGQVRGLTRMVEEENSCEQILIQLLAARSALDHAGMRIISQYIDHCIPEPGNHEEWETARNKLSRVLELLTRLA